MESASCRGCRGGGAARRGGPVRRWRGGTAEARREVVALVVSDCKRRGKQGGKGQWSTAVPNQVKGEAGEARTTRSPAARRGGAPVDPEHWDVLGRSGWCWEAQWSEERSLMLLEKLGRGFI